MKIFKEVMLVMCLMVLSTTILQAQNIAINSTGASPDSSSVLDISSANKGLLIPRIALTSNLDVTTISSPATSLLVYNTATAGTTPNEVLPGYYYWNGSKWVNFVSASNGGGIIGDIRPMIQGTDFNGWVLLDGRAISALTPGQQIAAISLGFTSNIPNATDLYLSQNGGSLGSVVGSNSVVLTQANLPNVNFSGTTSTDGAHSHNYLRKRLLNSQANGSGSTTVRSTTYTHTQVSFTGNHSHIVLIPSGGSATPLNIAPKTLIVNMFIYLGQ
jgi:microcystin-dependent protein